MPGPVYNAGDVIDKTLIAKTTVPVFKNPRDHDQPFSYVAGGDPVGVVYSFLETNPAADRGTVWWMFWDGEHNQYYAPHREGLYDVDALRQQGVLSTYEVAKKKEEENMPWYERLIKKYGIWVVGGAVAVAAVRGYFGRSVKPT